MLYIVPSRGRPTNAKELIDAWSATTTFSRLWICLDTDDPALAKYLELELPQWCEIFVNERTRLGPTLNFYADLYLKQDREHTAIGFMGDDHRPRTKDWDRKILDVLGKNGGTGVAYGNDLIQGQNLATSVAISANIVRELGYMVPPGMTHLFLDNAWMDIGRTVGNLLYIPEVVIEHMHPIAMKSEWDDLYREVNSGTQYQEDHDAYQIWLSSISWREKLLKLKAAV